MLEFLQTHWEIITIPFVSAFVGWFTNILAIEMMFKPIEFVGIKPFLGWQGIVPANSIRLARASTQLITQKILSLRELFAEFQADAFGAHHLDPVIDDITNQVIEEVQKRVGMLWENAGEFMQEKIRENVRAEVADTLQKIVSDFGDNITDILDLEKVVIEAAGRDKRLMAEMFQRIGDQEFKFIGKSGLWFGGLFGLVQMTIWVVHPVWWILPFFGFVVGYATNWIALKLVFEPKAAKKVGPWTVQGLFHKRQYEIVEKFAEMTAGRVLNAENIVTTVLGGESSKKVMAIVDTRVGELISKYEEHPMAAMVLPEDQRAELRTELMKRVEDDLGRQGGLLHVFAGKSINIQEELRTRMKVLDPESFESVLRPAFQQDEWKLIVAGAVLGLVAGVVQLVYLFSEALAQI